jgi:hypothetical protein
MNNVVFAQEIAREMKGLDSIEFEKFQTIFTTFSLITGNRREAWGTLGHRFLLVALPNPLASLCRHGTRVYNYRLRKRGRA